MTISALLLARQFYDLEPSERLKYATLGLLFVNVSIGGTLTHFAAPPVLMVARPWGWTTRRSCSPTSAGVRSSPSSYRRPSTLPRSRNELRAARQPGARFRTSSSRSRTQPGREPAARPCLDRRRAPGLHGVDGRERALPGAVHRRVPVLPGFRAGDSGLPEPGRAAVTAARRASSWAASSFTAGCRAGGSRQSWARLSATPLFVGRLTPDGLQRQRPRSPTSRRSCRTWTMA